MTGNRTIREIRERLGLTQSDLAERAGVSRQLVGALEVGRHVPRVDAALRLAGALGVEVASLFGPEADPLDVVSGDRPHDGAMVRLGRVGDRIVVSTARIGSSGWDSPDGVVEEGEVHRFAGLNPGVVMVGCEPGLGVLEQALREGGRGALAVTCSSAAAIRALEASRAHMAVVHGASDLESEAGDLEITRFHLCSWRVGLGGPADSSGWAEDAIRGLTPVAQREAGAGVQLAFERAAGRLVDGPLIEDHLQGARLAVTTGMPAVTIEPAALAAGAGFYPLETHSAELWVSRRWVGDSGVEAVMNEISGERFQRRLAAVGGYDLSRIGSRTG